MTLLLKLVTSSKFWYVVLAIALAGAGYHFWVDYTDGLRKEGGDAVHASQVVPLENQVKALKAADEAQQAKVKADALDAQVAAQNADKATELRVADALAAYKAKYPQGAQRPRACPPAAAASAPVEVPYQVLSDEGLTTANRIITGRLLLSLESDGTNRLSARL